MISANFGLTETLSSQTTFKNPSLVLAKINNFSEHKGGDSTVYEGGEGVQFISLEDLVNRSFKW